MGPAVGRIRERATFRALARPAGRGRSGPVSVSFTPVGDDGRPRVAYAIGRRHGNAVQRNRLRRRLRACVQTAVHEAGSPLAGGSYLVRADPTASELTAPDLARRVREALERASTPRPSPAGSPSGTGRPGDRWGKGPKQ